MATMMIASYISAEEKVRRSRRKGSYHLVASRNKLPCDPDEQEDDSLFQYLTSNDSLGRHAERRLALQDAKRNLLCELAHSGGDTTSVDFSKALAKLTDLWDPKHFDARKQPCRPISKSSSSSGGSPKKQSPQLEGMWIDLSKPKFSGCLGTNSNNEFLYTLGRMSFDMFRPTNLLCSIQGTFNPVHFVNGADVDAVKRVPESLKRELKHGSNVLRTYDVVTAFTIEPRSTTVGNASHNQAIDRPIEALMTTYGYVLPNPDKPNRLSIWWTGGTIEVNSDSRRWHKVFGSGPLPQRKLSERTRVLGATLAMGATPSEGMEEDGRMSYSLNRPLGGHETAYVDCVYLDENLRIARANTGVVYVFARVPHFPDE